MSPNIPGGMSNIPGNVAKHSGECRQTFQRMSLNNPENIGKDAGTCRKTPRWKVLKLSDE